MPRKTWNEKLLMSRDVSKVVSMDGKTAERFGPGTMFVPAPTDVDRIMKAVPQGQLVTTDQIRRALAQEHGANVTCPLTTGIFVNIAAYASEERIEAGNRDITPYWRTLRTGGELNEKFPGGIESQKALLEAEGHTVIQKGKRWVVKDHEQRLMP